MTALTVRPSTGVYYRDLAGGSLFDMTYALPPAELGASLADDDDSSFVTVVGSDDVFDRRGTMACVDFAPLPDLDVTVDPDGPQKFPMNISIRVERIPLENTPSAAIWGIVQKSADEPLSSLWTYQEMVTPFTSDWDHVPDTPTWLTLNRPFEFRYADVELFRTEGFTFATTLYDDQFSYAEDGDVARYRVFEVTLTFNVADTAPPYVAPSRITPSLRMLQRGGAGGMSGIPRMVGNPTRRGIRQGPGSIY